MSLNLLQMVTFLFTAYFGSHFCYHGNGKNWINPRILHLAYCSNKLTRRNLWKVKFIFWPHRGAKIASQCRYPFKTNPCYAEYFYVLHSSPIFILLTCSIPRISIYFQSQWKTVDPDQMASSEASWSGSRMFSKKDKSRFRRTRIKLKSFLC